MREIQKADPRSRKLAMLLVALTALLASLIVFAGHYFVINNETYFQDFLYIIIKRPFSAAVLAGSAMLPVIVVALYIFIFGQRVVSCRRMPPAGYKTIKDTVVYNGQAAVFRGRMLQGLAILLLFFSFAVPVLFWGILVRL